MRRDSMGCDVPNHRELKIGTLVGLLRQAGVCPTSSSVRFMLNTALQPTGYSKPRLAWGLAFSICWNKAMVEAVSIMTSKRISAE